MSWPESCTRSFIGNRAKALQMTCGQHGRTAESIAHMMLGYEMMLDYLMSCGAIHAEQKDDMARRAWQMLTDNSKKQSDDMLGDRPSKLFCGSVKEILVSGLASVRDLTGAEDKNRGYKDMIGYQDEGYYYLMPQVSYRSVVKLCNDQGQAFPLTQRMLYKQMREDGMLTGDHMSGGVATRPKYIDGKSQRLLWIPRMLIDGPRTGGIEQVALEGGGAGGSDDRYASFVSAIDEYESLLKRRDACYRAELSASCALLEELPETESAVLYDYYVQVEKVDAIARRMRYSESYVRRMKARGEQRMTMVDESKVQAALPDWYLLQEREAAGA